MVFDIFVLSVITLFAAYAFAAFTVLKRALHMYQQASYQNKSYIKWLKDNKSEILSPVPLVLLLVFALAIMLFKMWSLWLAVLALALFALSRRPRKPAIKPLVYTPRIRRLIATAVLFCALLGGAAYGLIFWLGMPAFYPFAVFFAGLLLLQYPLVMAYAAINSPVERGINRHYINDARRILQSHKSLTVIGITGSFGKTSTKHFLYDLLSLKYSTYMTPGNFNTTLGVVRAVRGGLKSSHDIFLCEMGARHKGDIAEICSLVQPDIGILTYIGPQHLETFGSQDAVTQTKLELYDAVRQKGTLFYNGDSPILAAQNFKGTALAYGSKDGAAYRTDSVSILEGGLSFRITAPNGDSALFKTRLLGRANVENLSGAIAVAHSLGISFADMVPAVAMLKSVPHRLELKRLGSMTIIDDAYNSNPLGANVALEALSICRGSRICITPGLVELGEKEKEYNTALGQKAALCCDYLIAVGKNQGKDVLAGAFEGGMSKGCLYSAASVKEAMEHAAALTSPNKFVLLLNDLPDSYL